MAVRRDFRFERGLESTNALAKKTFRVSFKLVETVGEMIRN